ncbi:tail fiber assembly protein [Yersinia enterocolitica]|nr:tail fiber assembly protein [Yersinia enterocolitica]ELI7927399.1 tail fiber assembly protein [Yersinia enterocolitica]ELI7958026.1 tail fiber assembly protein [Yersinia enterocolitica]ELI8139934.1 tail fiber assembly protein [Yersinia enterocolitica]ELI8181873.1 tail fiber assembly protein [Yersinia enterocolitica]
MYCFSATTLSFYPKELLEIYADAGTLPGDLVEIDDDVYAQFSDMPPIGKKRGANKKGMPKWVDIPAPVVTDNDIAATARRYRDAFIAATDALTIIDYSIDDSPLTDEQRSELMAVRLAFKAWPTVTGWPLVELPELPQWLLIEAVNNGYRVPVWPDAAYVA